MAAVFAVALSSVVIVVLVAGDRSGPSMSASEFEEIWLASEHVGPIDVHQ